MVIKVGINGFGRIGRVVFRTCFQNHELMLSAINDPAIDIEYICYLMKFDSTHGKLRKTITHTNEEIFIDDHKIKIFRQKLPRNVPWHTAGVQYVVEASGMFTSQEKAAGHLSSKGVKRVIVTAPSVDVPMIILGVNDNYLSTEHRVLSCASSTLYCLAPIIKVLNDRYGVAEGFITSIHAMTPSLKPLDGLCMRGKYWRDNRSIHQNIIPANTGACKALGKVIPQVKDKLTGLAFRVPIVNVSVLDLTIRLNSNTSIQDIVQSVETAGKMHLQNIIKTSNDNAVSSDFIGDNHSCILDINSSLQLKPNFFKLICWYENEYSYSCRVLDSIIFSEQQFAQSQLLASKMSYMRSQPAKKQDEIQQTDRNNKEISIECHYDEEIRIKGYNSSEDAVKPISRQKFRPFYFRKPFSLLNKPVLRDHKKKNDIKASNDRKSSKQSLVEYKSMNSSSKAESLTHIEAQDRLDYVKKEFSKMLEITEDLLKKSCNRKVQIEDTVTESRDTNVSAIASVAIEHDTNRASNNSPVYNECGDFKFTPAFTCNINIGHEKENKESISLANTSTYTLADVTKTCHNTEKPILEDTLTQETKPIVEKLVNEIMICDITKHLKNEMISLNATSPSNSLNALEVGFSNSINTLADRQSTKVENNYPDFNQGIPITQPEISLPESKSDNQNNKDPTAVLTDQIKSDAQISTWKSSILKDEEKCNLKEYLESKSYNLHVLDEELKKRNLLFVKFDMNVNDIEQLEVLPNSRTEDKQIDDVVEKMAGLEIGGKGEGLLQDDLSRCESPEDTETTISNTDRKLRKEELYEKLDSTSASDSDNSFQVNERKSQVIHITDLTNSIEDLSRLDKICRIIEISDELSDKLFSNLNNCDQSIYKHKKWSFNDLCERIQLDEFCNNVFGKSSA